MPTPQSSESARPTSTTLSGEPLQDLLAPAGEGQASSARPPSPDKAWETWKRTNAQPDFQTVLKALDGTVRKGLGAFGKGQEHLLPRARILAAEAVRKYAPEERQGPKRASLSTHVYTSLQRLQRVSADRDAAVRLPERSRLDAMAIRDAAREWEDQHGHEPDLATLSDVTGLSRDRILLAGRAFREISFAGVTGEKGDTLLQTEAKVEEDPWRDYVYYDLDPKGRKVFEWTTGYGGSGILPKQEIAKRLGISPAAVSGRIKTIVARLEERPGGRIV